MDTVKELVSFFTTNSGTPREVGLILGTVFILVAVGCFTWAGYEKAHGKYTQMKESRWIGAGTAISGVVGLYDGDLLFRMLVFCCFAFVALLIIYVFLVLFGWIRKYLPSGLGLRK